MGSVTSRVKRYCRKEPVYNRVNPAHITLDPGRSFDEIFATVRSFGIDPKNPTIEDMANLEWKREIMVEKDQACVQADMARWTAQAKILRESMPKAKRYKKKPPQTPEEKAETEARRAARRERNRQRSWRKELQTSRELVSLH